jgi:hypothetical protein
MAKGAEFPGAAGIDEHYNSHQIENKGVPKLPSNETALGDGTQGHCP